MLEKIQIIKQRFDEINDLIIQPDIISDQKRYIKLNKEYKDLKKVVDKGLLYESLLNNINEANEIMAEEDDAEMVEMAKLQLEEAKEKLAPLEDEIKFLLIPKDPDDAKNIVVEVRAGTGGDEASIFAGDLYRMYSKYCSDKSWKVDVVSLNEGTSGGFKEIIFEVSGEDVYGTMKFEAGVHRVQRVPETESQGRVHTSAITVAVLPEAEEVDVELNMATDVRRDTFRASGAGGQHVNKTESAVRIKHVPSGIVVACQSERSQHKNRATAMKMLKAKLYELEVNKRNAAAKVLEESKSDVSWGHQIRSYVLDQSRIKDLRTNVEVGNTQGVLDGDLDPFISESLKQGV